MTKSLRIKRNRSIVADYRKGELTYQEIADRHGCHLTTVSIALNKAGIKRNRQHLLNGKKQELLRLYKTGRYYTTQLAKRYGVSNSLIRKHLHSKGIKIDPKTYHLNEHVFDKVESEEALYWAGMMLGDGCNDTKIGVIRFSLSAPDHKLLYKLRDFLESDHRIYLKKLAWNSRSHNTYGMDICAPYLSKRLEELGMTKQKTWNLVFPDWVDENNLKHFLRGYSDSNGSILTYIINGNLIINYCIASRREFLVGVCRLLTKIFPDVHINISKNGRRGWLLQIRERKGCRKVLEWLYKDATIYMPRKRRAYQKMMKAITWSENRPHWKQRKPRK